jgi:hypothetical protein
MLRYLRGGFMLLISTSAIPQGSHWSFRSLYQGCRIILNAELGKFNLTPPLS